MASVHTSPAPRIKQPGRLRIIVADDDALMREFYSQVLVHLGYDVVASAADGAELVAACEATAVDLVVTDIRMPGMSGIDAARIIAKRVQVPFLFVSAFHDEILTDQVSPNVRYAYLKKPIKEEHLAAMVRAAVRGHTRRRHSNQH
jgi:response regulator NasT